MRRPSRRMKAASKRPAQKLNAAMPWGPPRSRKAVLSSSSTTSPDVSHRSYPGSRSWPQCRQQSGKCRSVDGEPPGIHSP